jgi:DNA-binding CsgD family transcriptional regulator
LYVVQSGEKPNEIAAPEPAVQKDLTVLMKPVEEPVRLQACPLTAREQQVVRLLSLGCSVREVATILGLSPSTVDNHKARAMKKLGVRKLALLLRIAIRIGVTHLYDELTEREQGLLS